MNQKTRGIVVDGAAYRWSYAAEIVRTAPAERTLLHVRIWGAEKSGAMARVECVVPHHGYIFVLHPKHAG